MGQSHLGIEKELEAASQQARIGYYDRYIVLRDRFLQIEYQHTSTTGDNSGEHITRVLEKLDALVASAPISEEILNSYELFLAMTSILYHDLGRLRGPESHSAVSGEMVRNEQNPYLIPDEDKESIAAVVACFSDDQGAWDRLAARSQPEYIGSHNVNLARIAALVTLADDLDEDYRRADWLLLERKGRLQKSDFLSLSRKRVLSVQPIPASREIVARVALQEDDLARVVEVEGHATGFVPAIARKLERLNMSRVRANRFLPEPLKYRQMRVHLTVAGTGDGRDRQFVFLDATNARDFLNACPEVVADPATETLMQCLELIGCGRYDEALRELEALEVVAADLPDLLRVRIPYDIACIYSLRARRSRGQPREMLLGAAYGWLSKWIALGMGGTWKALAFLPKNEIRRLVEDPDLRPVLKARQEEIRQLLPRRYRAAIPAALPRIPGASGSGSGCSPRGASIAVAGGIELVENLRPGDAVVTVDPITGVASLADVGHVHICTAAELIVVNEELAYTSTQPLFSAGGAVRVGHLRPGMVVYDQQLRPYRIRTVRRLRGLFDVYDLSIRHPNHSYVSQGLLCHNKFKVF